MSTENEVRYPKELLINNNPSTSLRKSQKVSSKAIMQTSTLQVLIPSWKLLLLYLNNVFLHFSFWSWFHEWGFVTYFRRLGGRQGWLGEIDMVVKGKGNKVAIKVVHLCERERYLSKSEWIIILEAVKNMERIKTGIFLFNDGR